MSEQQILNEIKDLKALVVIPIGRWLSLQQACKYANCGKQALIKMYEEGHIKAMQHPDKKNNCWVFDRESIDAYYAGLCTCENVTQKALKILQKV